MRKYRQRIHYTEADKNMMWDRWRKGESLESTLNGQMWTFRFVETREAGLESLLGVDRELIRLGISTP